VDTQLHAEYLQEIIAVFKKENIRVSIFCDPVLAIIDGAAKRVPTALSFIRNRMQRIFQ